jgi:hypothetical protein
VTGVRHGFGDELIKLSVLGALGGLGKLVARHPMQALGVGMLAGSTGVAGASGFAKGLRGGEKGRYLAASKHGPSQAAYINYHPLFEHKPTRAQLLRLHEHYRPGAFRR